MCLHCIQVFRIVKNKPLSLKIKFLMYVPVFFIFYKIKKKYYKSVISDKNVGR